MVSFIMIMIMILIVAAAAIIGPLVCMSLSREHNKERTDHLWEEQWEGGRELARVPREGLQSDCAHVGKALSEEMRLETGANKRQLERS